MRRPAHESRDAKASTAGAGDASRPGAAAAAPRAATPAWTRYWATGVGHSCAGSFEQAYGGTVGAFWQEAFALLPRAARVLDIACGNGSLARLLTAVRDDVDLRCDAVDLADVRPAWARDDPRLVFHPGTPAEALPFADASFDLVASQYGVEYADLGRALPEALRVVRPGGLVHFVVHYRDGRPCTLAREELAHLDWLERAGGWFDAAAAMLEPMGLLAEPGGRERLQREPRFAAVRQAFDAVVAEAQRRQAASPCGDLLGDVHDWTTQAFRVAGTQGRLAATPALAEVRRTLADIRARLEDLVAHALDETALARITATAHAAGWVCASVPLRDRGHLMGIALTLHRAQVRPGS